MEYLLCDGAKKKCVSFSKKMLCFVKKIDVTGGTHLPRLKFGGYKMIDVGFVGKR